MRQANSAFFMISSKYGNLNYAWTVGTWRPLLIVVTLSVSQVPFGKNYRNIIII